MEHLIELGVFVAKVVVVVIGLIALFAFLMANAVKHRTRDHLELEDVNERFRDFAAAIKSVLLDKKQLKEDAKAAKKEKKAQEKKELSRVFVIKFEGNMKADQVNQLRDEITAVLTVARQQDEVVILLESPGGMVHSYGLAAAQLLRIREHGIRLTACVDKVAASGGYLMACTANKIVAAPFAILGSIGVVAQVPNVHRFLKKHDVDYEEITAGEYKRTVSMLGEITEKGRQKFTEQVEETHVLFKKFVQENRPQLKLEKVATGEYWYGTQALEFGLIDGIMTSDEYLFALRDQAHIVKVSLESKKSFSEKISEAVAKTTDAALTELKRFF